jgi:phosphoglycerate dehydrogenase-like enzyme
VKVVLTSKSLPIDESNLAAFNGMDVEFVAIDGSSEQQLIDGTHDADALIVVMEDISATVISHLEHCRSISRLGIGYDTIDVPAATEHGVWVTNVPDANYREVAVHAMAMALALTRKLPTWDAAMKTEGWAPFTLGAGIRRPDDQLFGLIGIGRIGQRVAAMAAAAGYRVQAYDPILTEERARELGIDLVTLDQAIATSNVLSLHVPLTDSTRGMIDADAIAQMPAGSVLVNVSRGGLVDEAALATALENGHLAGAGIDVFVNEPLEAGNPLLTAPRILLSPHAAHYSAESFDETRQKVFDEAARVLLGEPPRYPVNSLADESSRAPRSQDGSA